MHKIPYYIYYPPSHVKFLNIFKENFPNDNFNLIEILGEQICDGLRTHPKWNEATLTKINTIINVLNTDVPYFVFSDVDIVFTNNFITDFNIFLNSSSHIGAQLLPMNCYESGFLFIKNNDITKRLFSTILNYGLAYKTSDWVAFREIIPLYESILQIYNLSELYYNISYNNTINYNVESINNITIDPSLNKPYMCHATWCINHNTKLELLNKFKSIYTKKGST